MRVLLIACLLASASSAWAEWLQLFASADGVLYVDPGSIRRNGELRRAAVLLDFAKTEGASAMSNLIVEEHDCSRERRRVLAFSEYSGPMASGTLIHHVPLRDTAAWHPVPAGAEHAAVRGFLCAR
jgi:hypothetical protein